MAEGRQQQDWNHTAAILCMIYNANRDPKKTRPAKPSDFMPAKPGTTAEPMKISIKMLKRQFDK